MRELAQHERVGIAYSGGVDSATLSALALRALGPDRVVALLGVSPSLARRERRIAHEVANDIGLQVHEIETHEGERPEYVANGVDRCFFCKDELFTRIDSELLDELRLDAVAYGENADDAKRPDRPGASAATNHAVLRPLASAGLTKSDVRELARALSVPVANKPAAPCLASRIPHGEEVTPAKLRQVEDLEDAVFDLGFSDCRARHHGRVARLELPRNELARAVEPEVRAALVAAGKAAGFAYVSLDLDGLQSGAFTLSIMNAKGTL
ncbi:ATP-dependent sacrificial sulfur transferase LarE [Dermabacter hominis]|uniref:ATP-dependent sacrificial sulfur transferase LarE n=1 Tax=Dermabacter hominis TaxID=36740 RepID=UPI00242AF0F7|nr:ATP-dependent sacrificial sulfur transferase LarE [Dermabacter hominis]